MRLVVGDEADHGARRRDLHRRKRLIWGPASQAPAASRPADVCDLIEHPVDICRIPEKLHITDRFHTRSLLPADGLLNPFHPDVPGQAALGKIQAACSWSFPAAGNTSPIRSAQVEGQDEKGSLKADSVTECHKGRANAGPLPGEAGKPLLCPVS